MAKMSEKHDVLINIKVKLSLWSAIKIRIAGVKELNRLADGLQGKADLVSLADKMEQEVVKVKNGNEPMDLRIVSGWAKELKNHTN
jgi:hypothetical protein